MKKLFLRVFVISVYGSFLLIHSFIYKISVEKIRIIYMHLWENSLSTSTFDIYNILWFNLKILTFSIIIIPLWIIASLFVKYFYLFFFPEENPKTFFRIKHQDSIHKT